MKLNEELAEQIVFHAKRVIQYPLNVMDSEGIIIASTNPSRCYQKHSGAILVLNQRSVIEITDAMAMEMRGTQAGINLPIMFKNEIVGVIGISGPPDEIRHWGELVKMASEMTVENAYVLEQNHWRELRKQDLVLQWIENTADFAMIESQAIPLRIDLRLGYVVCIIEVQDDHRLIDLHTSLKHWNKERLFVQLGQSRMLVLLKHSTGEKDWELLKRYLDIELNCICKCSVGKFYPDPRELYASYQSAQAAMDLGKKLYPDESYYDFEKLKLACILDAKRKNWQDNLLFSPILQLDEMDPVYKKTLLCWFENNLDNAKTAEHLYIHRNTLRYRLNKISEVCELDLDVHADRVWLYVGLILG